MTATDTSMRDPTAWAGENLATSSRPDDEHCYLAVKARDARFDGCFFTGVTSTGIYCRPSCSSVTPRRDRVRFYLTAAAAQRAGFRACKRCRPDASPGSPEWNRRGDVVGRAMRSIHEGVVDREGVSGLARTVNYSPRQLQRLLVSEVGAGALELARAQRADTARVLIETTDLRAAEIAFAAGFGSVRQFNDTVLTVFGESPKALRARADRLGAGGVGHTSTRVRRAGGKQITVTLRLAFRPPIAADVLFGFLGARAVPGVEEGDETYYRRALSLPRGAGVVTVRHGGDAYLSGSFQLDDLRDLTTAVGRVRRMLDLDSDPIGVGSFLAADPVLGELVKARPGLRVPGQVDANEMAVRAVVGQQVSVSGARTLAARLAADHGRALKSPVGSVIREFPSPHAIAALGAEELPMPTARARALVHLCEELASGRIVLGPGADRERVSAALLEMPGIGQWTVAYLRMRALSDPDAFLASDLGVRKALLKLGLGASEREATALAERWRPYRAYALQYLWSSLAADGPQV